MNRHEMGTGQPAFLLAQVGAHAASQFAERLGVLGLVPADAGILRLLRMAAGLSQQELAAKLQIHPSRMVAIVDNLEKRGLIERKANPVDRRLYSLYLTQAGGEALEKIGKVFNVSKERIRQIEKKALRKLKNPNRQACLKTFIE